MRPSILSIRPLEAVLQDPGALWVAPSDWVLDSYRAVLRSSDDGGQGFLTFMRNSAIERPSKGSNSR